MSNIFALTQRAYRFFNDDGSESTATVAAAENTAKALTDSATPTPRIVLRVSMAETGAGSVSGAATDDYQLQVSKNGAAFANVTTASSNVKAYDSSNLTNDGATTNSADLSNPASGSFVAGEVSEDGLVDNLQITANNYTELLYTLEMVPADVASGDTLTFRVLLNGATTNVTYSQTPTINVVALQDLTPGLVTNSQTFYAPTVASTYALTPGLVTNSQTFHAPTVTPGAVDLTPGLVTNDQTFYAPTVALVDQFLTPGLVTNDQTFPAPTALSIYPLTPSLITNDQTFYAPTGSATYGLAASLVTNSQTFHAPAVTSTYDLTPGLVSNSQTFHTPSASSTYSLSPELVTNTQTFGATVVSVGADQALLPGLVENAQTFFSPTVLTPFLQDLIAGLVTNVQDFYSPTVALQPPSASQGRPGGIQAGIGREGALAVAGRPVADGGDSNRSNRQGAAASRNNTQSGSVRRH